MQEFFTQATVALELVSFGYVASSFAAYAHRRVQEPTRWSRHWVASTKTLLIDDPALSQPNHKQPPVERLRQQCQQAGIRWRNAHGKNKHLKKAEMIEALQQLERSKKSVVPPSPTPSQTAPQRRAA